MNKAQQLQQNVALEFPNVSRFLGQFSKKNFKNNIIC